MTELFHLDAGFFSLICTHATNVSFNRQVLTAIPELFDSRFFVIF